MKSIITVLLLSCLFGLSSCSEDSGTTNLVTVPVEDTITKGSYLQIAFLDKSFYISDISVNNSPIYEMFANSLFNDRDSIWSSKLVLTDYRNQKMALYLNTKTNNANNIGKYFVQDNTSTLTDFSGGENKNYAITTGSHIEITTYASQYLEGSLYLNLRYNYAYYVATGHFKIFR